MESRKAGITAPSFDPITGLHIECRYNSALITMKYSRDLATPARLSLLPLSLIGIIEPPTHLYILIRISETSSVRNLTDMIVDRVKISRSLLWQWILCCGMLDILFECILPAASFFADQIGDDYNAHDKGATKNSRHNADNSAGPKSRRSTGRRNRDSRN